MTDPAQKNGWQVSPEKKDDNNTATPASSSLAEDQVGINEKALLRKIDMRVLPALTILYLLSFLDRSNGMHPLHLLCKSVSEILTPSFTVGNARLEGMTTDINMCMTAATSPSTPTRH